jgi:hypothetical protein
MITTGEICVGVKDSSGAAMQVSGKLANPAANISREHSLQQEDASLSTMFSGQCRYESSIRNWPNSRASSVPS